MSKGNALRTTLKYFDIANNNFEFINWNILNITKGRKKRDRVILNILN